MGFHLLLHISNTAELGINMSQDLRVKLGKSRVESSQQGDPRARFSPEAFSAALEAFRAGKRRPEPRFPVVISHPGGDGALDGAERLQKLATLLSVPEVSTTRTTQLMGGYDGDEVQIVDASYGKKAAA